MVTSDDKGGAGADRSLERQWAGAERAWGQLSEEQARQLVAQHCSSTTSDAEQAWLIDALRNRRSVDALVVSCDLRKSTLVMKEAIDFVRFAELLRSLVDTLRDILDGFEGWFDKFTGDGFLAYWVLGDWHGNDEHSALEDVWLRACKMAFTVIAAWDIMIGDQFRANSQNFPAGVGFSFGLDSGACYPVPVAGDLTLVGLPVVGAVRMCEAAAAHEVICNAHLGQAVRDAPDGKRQLEMNIEVRHTKEHNQEVWRLTQTPETHQALLEAYERMRTGTL